jgi:hypothetical protein
MADDPITVAKDITVAILPRLAKLEGKASKNVDLGEAAGDVFRGVYKQVLQAVAEANRPPGEKS